MDPADRARRHDDRGASALELAFLVPVLAILVFGALDFGRAYRLHTRLDAAATAGATYAVLYPNDVDCGTTDDILSRVDLEDEGLTGYSVTVLAEDGSGDLTVPVTGCGGSTVESGERVRVEVTATFDLSTPLLTNVVGNSLTLTGAREVEAVG